MASGKPFSPSVQMMNASFIPRFFRLINTDIQNLAPSVAFTHRPRTDFSPSMLIPIAVYTARLSTLPSCRIFTIQSVEVNDWVETFQRPVLPRFHLVHHAIGDFGNQRRTYVHSVHVMQMTLNIPHRHSQRIHG